MGIPQDIATLGAQIEILNDVVNDLVDRVEVLSVAVATLDDRVVALEAYVVRNDNRIKTIEAFMADHQAGAERRQREVNQALQAAQRARWQQRTGRQT